MATTANDILVRVIMQTTSGLPADVIVNDWAFHKDGAAPSDADLTTLRGIVDTFYNDVQATTFNVATYLGEWISRAATHQMAFYEAGSPLGSPRLELDWIGPSAPLSPNQNLPTEVSAVLSFHAELTGIQEELGATRPKARRRGRVYVGPLTFDAIEFTQDSPILATTFRTTMQQAAVSMFDAADATDWVWSVWSRADDILRPVVGGWTDDAPDTQRRRGVGPSSRTVFGNPL